MSVQYKAILWNPQKRVYDLTLAAGVFLYLALFIGAGALIHPNAPVETLLIRGLGTAAFLLLHIVLCIGPLCRLDSRFLPLLYNRRHLGVTTFLLGLGHGIFGLIQFHALGDVNPLISLFTSNTRYGSLSQFPFQSLGFFALLILYVMAATSHDFWLHTLSAPVWKRIHMAAYLAYVLLVAHVLLGALQSETSPWLAVCLGVGIVTVVSLHITAGLREHAADNVIAKLANDGYVDIGRLDAIPDGRAKTVCLAGERIAVFHHGGKASALSNVCRHQNGPLGEGRIIDGCVTCPWHGYQYFPDSGASPPPFDDRVPTYPTRLASGHVYVLPKANAGGPHS
ncbi:MAG: Rieske 2Fe-2S domain-containing protein [Bryobacteraceae bacterium]